MTNTTTKWLMIVGAIVLWSAIVRGLFPRVQVIQTPVAIRTIHDTVSDTIFAHDTLKIKVPMKPDTVWLTHETVGAPKAYAVIPPTTGIRTIIVPKHVGDTTTIVGFTIEPDTVTGYLYYPKLWKFYTTGPLAVVQIDEANDRIGAAFWPAPAPDCTLGCKFKLVVEGATAGILTYVVLHH
jgi:hypothetical protein